MNTARNDTPSSATWVIEMFHDGDCPLCSREVALLRRLDRKQRIKFTNIAAESFNPTDFGKSLDELMENIHGRFPDGRWVTGVEVFRHLYSAVGLGYVARVTRLPIITRLLDLGYRFFAKNRLKLTSCRDRNGACRVDPAPRKSDDQATSGAQDKSPSPPIPAPARH